MKLIKRILLVLFILSVIVVASSAVYINFYSKPLLQNTLTKSLNRNVEFNSLSYHFPFGLSAKNVTVENLLKVNNVYLYLNLSSIFSKKITVSKLILDKPLITINKKSNPEINTSIDKKDESTSPPTINTTQPVSNEKIDTGIDILITQVKVKNGQLIYQNAETKKKTFELKNVQLKINDLIFPIQSTETTFEFDSQLVKDNSPLTGSLVEGSGWLNLKEKNMDGNIKVVDSKGIAGLTAHLFSKANDMIVTGHLKMSQFKTKLDSNSPSIDKIVFGTLSNMGVDIGANFSFQTKMDDFKLSNIAFSGSVNQKPATP